MRGRADHIDGPPLIGMVDRVGGGRTGIDRQAFARTRQSESAHVPPLRIDEALNLCGDRGEPCRGFLRECERLPERRIMHGRAGLAQHERCILGDVARVHIVLRLE